MGRLHHALDRGSRIEPRDIVILALTAHRAGVPSPPVSGQQLWVGGPEDDLRNMTQCGDIPGRRVVEQSRI